MSRKNARHLIKIDNFQRFYTFLMPKRTQSICWTVIQTEATNLLAFIKQKKQEGFEITIFHITIAALLRTASQFPELNRFIYGHKFYAREEYTFSFAVNLGKNTVMRKIWLKPEYDLFTVSEKLREIVSKAHKNPDDSLDSSIDMLMKLPSFITSIITKVYPWLVDKCLIPLKVVEDDVLYSSAIISNLGSFGLNAPFHHLYEWGNTSVFITMGILRKAPIVLEDNTLKVADILDFGFTVDERICDGKKLSEALLFFKKCIEDPRILATTPQEVIRE